MMLVYVCVCVRKRSPGKGSGSVGWFQSSLSLRAAGGGGDGGVVYTSSLSTLTKLPPILAVPDPYPPYPDADPY